MTSHADQAPRLRRRGTATVFFRVVHAVKSFNRFFSSYSYVYRNDKRSAQRGGVSRMRSRQCYGAETRFRISVLFVLSCHNHCWFWMAKEKRRNILCTCVVISRMACWACRIAKLRQGIVMLHMKIRSKLLMERGKALKGRIWCVGKCGGAHADKWQAHVMARTETGILECPRNRS